MKALLGKKIGMTQVFAEDRVIPVTVIEAGPCDVIQVKTKDKEGYSAVQIGYGEIKEKHLTKPLKGHYEKAKVKPKRHLAEYRIKEEKEAPEIGAKLACDIFVAGELTEISANSKGKGFQGVIKRHGFAGGPGGHGSHFHRSPGSIGMAATPSRVLKGTKLPGQMGASRVTTKNLEVVKVYPEQNIILIKGAVPGGKGSLLMVKATGKSVKHPAKLVEVKVETETVEKKAEKKEETKQTVEKEDNKDKPKDIKDKKVESKEEEKKESNVESQESKEKQKSEQHEKQEAQEQTEKKEVAKDKEEKKEEVKKQTIDAGQQAKEKENTKVDEKNAEEKDKTPNDEKEAKKD